VIRVHGPWFNKRRQAAIGSYVRLSRAGIKANCCSRGPAAVRSSPSSCRPSAV